MRRRKDPAIRQEVFIQAATELFIEKGYEGVSVRELLAAVDDKSASPSVFYYYFRSKEDLYHACIQFVGNRYVEGFRTLLVREYSSFEERMLAIVDHIGSTLENDRNIAKTGSSIQNQVFLLAMREKVTREIAQIWLDALGEDSLLGGKDAVELVRFISGGISEMIYCYMLSEERGRERLHGLARNMALFCMNTLEVGKEERTRYLTLLDEHLSKQDPLVY